MWDLPRLSSLYITAFRLISILFERGRLLQGKSEGSDNPLLSALPLKEELALASRYYYVVRY